MARARDILLRLTGDPSDATAALDKVKGELKTFDQIKAEARAEIKTAAAKAELEKLQARLERYGKQEQTADVKIRTAKTLEQIERVEKKLAGIKDQTVDVNVKEHKSPASGASGAAGGAAAVAGGAKAGIAGIAAGGFGVLGKEVVSEASDINESLSKNIVLFKSSAKEVERFADRSGKAYGIAKKDALEYTGTFGNLFRAFGETPKQSAKFSVSLTKLGADLASFNNTSVTDALEAIRSGLTGEVEPLRRYGVNLSENALKAEALASGIVKASVDTGKLKAAQITARAAQEKYSEAVKKHGKNSKEAEAAQGALLRAEGAVNKARSGSVPVLTAQQKALAAQNLIYKQTKTAQGDFARTSGGLANQQRILSAEVSDAGGAIGKLLLPIVLDVTKGIVEFINIIRDGIPRVKKTISEFVAKNREDIKGLLQAFKNIGVAVKAVFFDVVLPAIKAALPGIKDALGGIIEIARGVIRIFTAIFTGDFGKALDGVKDIFHGAIDTLKGILRTALGPFRKLGSAIGHAISGGIKGALNGLKKIGEAAINAMISVINKGIGLVNGALRPRDLGVLGHSPGIHIDPIGKIGGSSGGKTPAGTFQRDQAPKAGQRSVNITNNITAPSKTDPAHLAAVLSRQIARHP
jgi:hypothetical protein